MYFSSPITVELLLIAAAILLHLQPPLTPRSLQDYLGFYAETIHHVLRSTRSYRAVLLAMRVPIVFPWTAHHQRSAVLKRQLVPASLRYPATFRQQNATSNPTSAIFSTRLGDQLPTCGSGTCCPFGYNCETNGGFSCSLITSTSIVGKTDASSGTPSSSTTSSATKTSSISTSSSTSSSTAVPAAAQAKSQCNRFPIGVFLAGLFPGMFVGAFIMLAWVICSGRHRKPSSRNSSGSSISYKPTISDPIPMSNDGGLRTDFLRKTTDRAKSMFSTRDNRSSEQYANNWKMPTPPVINNVPVATGVPVTPERRQPYESDQESIKIYSPPSAVQQPYPAHIAPLRGMTTQRTPFTNPNTNNMGSPFQTPPSNNPPLIATG